MQLSPDDRQAVAGRAATVFERAAALAAGAGRPEPPGEAAHAALARWRQLAAQGDTEAFARRLAWDGLDEWRALEAIATPLDPHALDPGHWTDWLDRFLAEAPPVLADLREGRWAAPGSDDAGPFEELRAPFRRAGRRALLRALAAAGTTPDRPSPFDIVDACIFGQLETQLDREITRTAELAWFDLFRASNSQAPASTAAGADRYRAFVVAMLDDGLPAFFRSHARLARQLATIAGCWVDASTELIRRLGEDRERITAALAGGADPGRLVHVEPALSDPHHGRRRVAALTFASGLRLVYKPRGLGIDEAFGRLLAWLNAGLDEPLRILNVLDRGTHGWVEYAAPEPAASREQAARYFRRAGALMCVTSLLGARDLHRDNLVAAADGPVLVDLELLLQPERADGAAAGTEEVAPASCLSTGMLSLIDLSPDGEPHDAGGLRGESAGALPMPRRAWRAVGTDALHFEDVSAFTTARSHELLVDGVVQKPGAFAGALKAGFMDAYRRLVDGRHELLAAGGPLEALASHPVRVLPRPTNQYAMLAALLATPACQRDGVAAGCAIDVLHRGFLRQRSRPALWPMVLEERQALLALDIPRFTVPAGGIRASAGDRTVEADYFTSSGLDEARRRLAALSPDDLDAQLALLDRALSESVASRYADLPGPRREGADRFIDDAVWIARELRNRAVAEGETLAWHYRRPVGGPGWRDHHLYDGTTGTALFFVALGGVTGDRAWTDAARAAFAGVARHLERHPLDRLPADEPVGAGNGLASVAWGLAQAAALGADPALMDVAGELARCVAVRLQASPVDVVNGSAGAALVLAALHEATGDPVYRAAAEACAHHLVYRASATGQRDLAWPRGDGMCLLGTAHGAAGIAWALARVAARGDDASLADAARRAFAFVRRHYHAAAGNWPVAVRGDEVAAAGMMTGWCHGAPGILIASLAAGPVTPRGALPEDEMPVLRTIAAWQPAQADHLCCGTMAKVEALLVASRATQREDLLDAARGLATRVVERAQRRGHFRLSGAGTDYRVFDPGLFQGLAGIGYTLLRTARPQDLPSVAAFDPPRATLRYCSPGAAGPDVHTEEAGG